MTRNKPRVPAENSRLDARRSRGDLVIIHRVRILEATDASGDPDARWARPRGIGV
jgi:hypothetical protein